MHGCPQESGGAASLFLTSTLNGNLHAQADLSDLLDTQKAEVWLRPRPMWTLWRRV